jgi:hypothetical protein
VISGAALRGQDHDRLDGAPRLGSVDGAVVEPPALTTYDTEQFPALYA